MPLECRDRRDRLPEDEEDEDEDDDSSVVDDRINNRNFKQYHDRLPSLNRPCGPGVPRRFDSVPFRRKPPRAPSVASSSTASVSLRFSSRLKLKRPFIVNGRRGGPSTPVPSWKAFGSIPLSPSKAQNPRHMFVEHQVHNHHRNQQQHTAFDETVSARKLAASLWEQHDLPFYRGGAPRRERRRHQHSNNRDHQPQRHRQHLPNHPGVKNVSPTRNNNKALMLHDKLKKKQSENTRAFERHNLLEAPPATDSSNSEVTKATATTRDLVPASKNLSASVGSQTTANELLGVLNHVWSLEEQHASSMTLVGALQAELSDVRFQLQEAILSEKARCKEVETLTKRLVEERLHWRQQQEDGIIHAVQSIRHELEEERKSKQKLENVHKRLERELRDCRRRLSKVSEDFERERKARELMEDVCDELAREISEDKARVEELKRESIKVREEVEEERKMLQMAEIWREERVQMKLMEAKLELEEKNSALDKLRGELEAFLKAKRAGDTDSVAGETPRIQLYRHPVDTSTLQSLAPPIESHALVPGRSSVDSAQDQRTKQGNFRGGFEEVHAESNNEEEDDDDEVDDDDLHSIDLNKESFGRPPNKWEQHEIENNKNTNKRNSVDQRGCHELVRPSMRFERPRSNRPDSGMRSQYPPERDHHWDWVEHNVEAMDTRKQESKEKNRKLWQNDHALGFLNSTPKTKGRKLQGHPQGMSARGSGFYVDGDVSDRHHAFSLVHDLHGNSEFQSTFPPEWEQ